MRARSYPYLVTLLLAATLLPPPAAAQPSQSATTWGDFDGDGAVEMLVTTLHRDGTLASDYRQADDDLPYTRPPKNLNGDGVWAWGDFDGDGDLDVAVVRKAPGNDEAVILFNRDGVYEETAVALKAQYDADDGGLFDVDRDGEDDLLLMTAQQGLLTAQVFTAEGDDYVDVLAATARRAPVQAWQDVDGDGDAEMLVTALGSGAAVTPYRRRDTSFVPFAPDSLATSTSQIIWDDFDGDGDFDFVLAGADFQKKGKAIQQRMLVFWNDPELREQFEFGGSLAAAPNASVPDVPDAFALHANYPNPFNPSTTFAFDLPEATAVRLHVYDALGRRVAVVLDETRPAGAHQVRWDARDLPSGVYFLRFVAGAFSATRQLVLTK